VATSFAALLSPVGAFGAASGAAAYDAVADFSVAGNPKGTWSYLAGGALLRSVQKTCDTQGMSCRWNGKAICNSAIVGASTTGGPISWATLRLPADHLEMDPEAVSNVRVRWTAPTAGSFEIKGDFLAVDTSQRIHPVAILSSGKQIYANTISSFGQQLGFDLTQKVTQGQTIDFVVSTGSACSFLSTGLKATIAAVTPVAAAPMPVLGGPCPYSGGERLYLAKPNCFGPPGTKIYLVVRTPLSGQFKKLVGLSMQAGGICKQFGSCPPSTVPAVIAATWNCQAEGCLNLVRGDGIQVNSVYQYSTPAALCIAGTHMWDIFGIWPPTGAPAGSVSGPAVAGSKTQGDFGGFTARCP